MSHLLEIRLFLGTKNYEERNVCPTKLIPMKEKMGKIGKKLWSQERGDRGGQQIIWMGDKMDMDRNESNGR